MPVIGSLRQLPPPARGPHNGASAADKSPLVVQKNLNADDANGTVRHTFQLRAVFGC